MWLNAPKDNELEGEVLNCLKENYINKKGLTVNCADQIKTITQQQALHYEQDAVLINTCGEEISRLCGNEQETNNPGAVEECLKTKFDQLNLPECQRHVAFLITAAQVDIQADPMLHKACAIDLVKYCKEVPSGDGRR